MLLQNLQTSYGLDEAVLDWFKLNRTCTVVYNTSDHRRPVPHRLNYCTEYRQVQSSEARTNLVSLVRC